MATNAHLTMRLLVNETVAAGATGISVPTLVHDTYKTETDLTSSTTPAITKVASFLTTLSGGAATIDLTALTNSGDTAGGSLDLTGLKVQAIYFETTSGDSAITITTGASNGYNLGGDASFSYKLAGGESCMFSWNETSQDVATADATIDLAGTGTDSIQCVLVAG